MPWPFIGDSPEAVHTTMRALMAIPRSRGAIGHLAIGGHPSTNDEQNRAVKLSEAEQEQALTEAEELVRASQA